MVLDGSRIALIGLGPVACKQMAERVRIGTPFRQLEIRCGSGVRHIAEKRGDAREQLTNRILPTFEDPDEVWLALYAVRDGRRARPEVRTHYVKVWDDEGSFGLGVEDRAGNVLWTWFPTDWEGLDRRRRGILVYAADRDGK